MDGFPFQDISISGKRLEGNCPFIFIIMKSSIKLSIIHSHSRHYITILKFIPIQTCKTHYWPQVVQKIATHIWLNLHFLILSNTSWPGSYWSLACCYPILSIQSTLIYRIPKINHLLSEEIYLNFSVKWTSQDYES